MTVSRNRKRSGSLFLAFLSLCAAFPLIFSAVGAFLVKADPLEQADAVVLLAGGDEARLNEVIQLVQDGWAHVVILTETGERVGTTTQDYIALVQRRLIQQGITSDVILQTPKAADSTREEAERVRDLMEQRGLHSALVVTDPYHTRRAAWLYHRVFKGSEIKISVRPASGHWYSPVTWWMKPEGWQVTGQEYIKFFGEFAREIAR